MPTKRVHRSQAARTRLSPAMMAQLQLGHVPEGTPGRAERFFWSHQLEPAWREFRDRILDAWTMARPGSRPWAWWQYDAPEPRRASENETTYLRRLRLLTRVERRVLSPAAFAPAAR